MSRKRRIRDHYEPRITPRRENYDVVNWASAASQRARFDVLIDHVPLAGRSLLDVGCGLGDLLDVLDERGVAVEYTGVDLLGKMVARARRRHPGRRFLRADPFAPKGLGGEVFDVVFCSGTFNLNLGNNLAFLRSALPRLFELAREHVVFNLLHKRSAAQERRYFHFGPDDVLPMLRPFGCEVRVIDDYLPNDFTLICRKPGDGP